MGEDHQAGQPLLTVEQGDVVEMIRVFTFIRRHAADRPQVVFVLTVLSILGRKAKFVDVIENFLNVAQAPTVWPLKIGKDNVFNPLSALAVKRAFDHAGNRATFDDLHDGDKNG